MGESGYLSKVGPAPIRLAIPVRQLIPRVASSATNPNPSTVVAAAEKAPAAETASVAANPPEFLGPPAPPQPAPPPPLPEPPRVATAAADLYPSSSPVTPSAVTVGDPLPNGAITAQMLVRFFKTPAGAASMTNSPPHAGVGTETSVWMPVQFVPPQPTAPLSSSASYQLAPPK